MSAATKGQYLTFFVGNEEYAIGILHAREILEYDTVTRVPGTPAWIRGVINLRGRVVPVMDLGARFGLQPSEVGRKTCIVIVEVAAGGAALFVGILADAVSEVVELGTSELLSAPAFGTRARAEYLKGMAQAGRKFVLVLDLDALCSTTSTSAGVLAAASAPPAGAPAREAEP